jgi:transposase
LPARPGRPRDKAKAEVGVQIVERWILARLRHQTFFSLDEMNERIAELLEDINDRVMRRYGESRRQLFERLERAALRPLPPQRFAHGEWKLATVNIDYHVDVDAHFYSVHYTLVHEKVDARFTANTVEIFHRGQRIALHVRSFVRGGFTTRSEHMPKSHQAHAEWSPSRMTTWAASVGPSAAALVTRILEERPHPEQGYRSCLGILRLGKRYGNERFESACRRALVMGGRSYRHVDSILKNGLDGVPLPGDVDENAPVVHHENVRGRDYYN